MTSMTFAFYRSNCSTKLSFFLTIILFVLASCAPRVSTKISKSYIPLNVQSEVAVLSLADSVPPRTEELGEVIVDHTTLTTKCRWEDVVERAKYETRKAGGNAIKLTRHNPPDMLTDCHRITAKMLKLADAKTLNAPDSLANADYAILYIYRHSGPGPLILYDLYLGDSIICQVRNNFKTSIKIRKEGFYKVWAKTEVKREVPLDIKFGNEYYIRCSVAPGTFLGRPHLERVKNEFGRPEYHSMNTKPVKIPVVKVGEGM